MTDTRGMFSLPDETAALRRDSRAERREFKRLRKLDRLLGGSECEIDLDGNRIVFDDHPKSELIYRLQQKYPELVLYYKGTVTMPDGELVPTEWPCCEVVMM